MLPLNGLGYQNLLQCQHEEYQALDLLHPLQLRYYELLICICSMHPAFSSKHTEVILWSIFTEAKVYNILNPFLAHVPILYPLKTPEYQRFSVVFRGIGFCCFSEYKIGTLARNELISFHILNILRQLNSQHLLVQSQQQKHLNNMWNQFKVDNKDNRTTSLASHIVLVFLLLTLTRKCRLGLAQKHKLQMKTQLNESVQYFVWGCC